MSTLPRAQREHRGSATARGPSGLRLGLCCQFVEQPIKFPAATATALLRLEPTVRAAKCTALGAANAQALAAAIEFCAAHGIGCFRINSGLLPVKTHPQAGYELNALPGGDAVIDAFRKCGALARQLGVRLTFHPDQFVVLNSPRPEVVERSIIDLLHHAEMAAWVGADVINIHAGGAYGDKSAALAVLARNLKALPAAVCDLLTLENDDKLFTPRDLLPLCRATGIPLTYDVHHHRCCPDGMTVDEASDAARETWNREPVFHLSSPLDGWAGRRPERHHDYVDLADFPWCWWGKKLTIEVEAKAKELAVQRLAAELNAVAACVEVDAAAGHSSSPAEF